MQISTQECAVNRVEVVYMVEGEIAPSRSHIEVEEITIKCVKDELNRRLEPQNKRVKRVTCMVELQKEHAK